MKIMIGICTCNRGKILQESIASLMLVDEINKAEIRIYDDCSKDYDCAYLQKLVPSAKITVNEKTLGADENSALMFKDFLSSNCDVLFCADSDLLYNRSVIKYINKTMCRLDFISLFNTPSHSVLADGYNNDFILEKENVGTAGCCLSKKAVEIIFKNIENTSKSFDYKFCNILKTNGIPVYTNKKSLVQHIGVKGQNSNGEIYDYGVGFDVDSISNGQSIETCMEDYYMLSQSMIREYHSRLDEANLLVLKNYDAYKSSISDYQNKIDELNSSLQNNEDEYKSSIEKYQSRIDELNFSLQNNEDGYRSLMKDYQNKIDELNLSIQQVKLKYINSTSWKITKPFRFVARCIKKISKNM